MNKGVMKPKINKQVNKGMSKDTMKQQYIVEKNFLVSKFWLAILSLHAWWTLVCLVENLLSKKNFSMMYCCFMKWKEHLKISKMARF